MPKKKKDKSGHNTRSKADHKDGEQGPRSADTNAPPKALLVAAKISPARKDKLPAEQQNVNTSVTETVSNQQRQADATNNIHNISPTSPSKILQMSSSDNTILNENGDGAANPGNGATRKVSDNREAVIQPVLPAQDHLLPLNEGALAAFTSELRAILSRMDALDKIELSVSTLVTQFGGIVERTSKVESKVNAHAQTFIEVNKEVSSLRESVEVQGRALVKLTKMKSDLSKQNKEVKEDLLKQNKGITKEMNHLVEQQKDQVNSFLSTTNRIEKNISDRVEKNLEAKMEEKIEEQFRRKMEEENISEKVERSLEENMEKKIQEQIQKRIEERMVEKASQESTVSSFQSLKDQAYSKRRNLVITGLQEDTTKSVTSAVKDVFKSIKADKFGIREACRIGQLQPDNTSYHRPVLEFDHFQTVTRFGGKEDKSLLWKGS